MDILKLIKERRTIRKYKKKAIPQKIIQKIVESGIWASSIHGFQPWRIAVITNKSKIKEIASILRNKSKSIGTGPNILMSSTAETIYNSPTIIAVYNTKVFVNFAKKFRAEYVKIAQLSEIEAISGAIQNIVLTAESFGIGSCWTVLPVFCEKEINKILNLNNSLLTILTVGYPAEEGKRSLRKPINEKVKYLK
ncbi:MAG: nitroreductase family protein [Candidatus Omnitrophota bacterium]|nr:nitroreductase family protein [Candidatus Omnitrophota bacterium]MBU1929235.1 nitroreductase family protein [Candidatus Omnitrophota bacterium]MBU2034382.1 nitroreductase family protein [Candidatus Omnitrophota bacterium]